MDPNNLAGTQPTDQREYSKNQLMSNGILLATFFFVYTTVLVLLLVKGKLRLDKFSIFIVTSFSLGFLGMSFSRLDLVFQ